MKVCINQCDPGSVMKHRMPSMKVKKLGGLAYLFVSTFAVQDKKILSVIVHLCPLMSTYVHLLTQKEMYRIPRMGHAVQVKSVVNNELTEKQ